MCILILAICFNKFVLCPLNNIIDLFKGYKKFYWSKIWNKFNKLNKKNLPVTNLSPNNTPKQTQARHKQKIKNS